MRHVVLLALSAAACQPPPPAPEGLDEATRYMVRNFWAEDAVFEAGITGYMKWFRDEGRQILGLIPGEEGKGTDAFTVTDLLPEDIEALPLDAEIVEDVRNFDDPEDDEFVTRDVLKAAGVVSLVEMDCTWREAEALLRRVDQNNVFPLDWEGYERSYATPLAPFEQATGDATFAPIPEPIDPYAEDFDPTPYASSILLTDNTVDPSAVFGLVNVGAYPLDLEFRHGIYDVGEEGEEVPTGVFAILTYNRQAVWDNAGNGLAQSYSIEIVVERPDEKALRMLTVWAEPRSLLIDSDNPIALNTAVAKARDSSVLLSRICSGEVDIAAD